MTDDDPVEPGPDAADRMIASGWVVTEPLDPQAVEELHGWIDAGSPMLETLLTRGEVSEHAACVFGAPPRLCTDAEPELVCVLAVDDLRDARAPIISATDGERPVPLWAGQALWVRPDLLVTTGGSGALIATYTGR